MEKQTEKKALIYDYWTYQSDSQELFKITPNIVKQRPETFFKYFALTEYAIDALENFYIYASHPNELNDPFDCDEQIIQFHTFNDIKEIWESLAEQLLESHNYDIRAAAEYTQKAYKVLLYKKAGILSLTDSNQNRHLWSLYAQNSGFCLEYDTTIFPFKCYGPFPIHYTDNMYPINFSKCGGKIATAIQTNIKRKIWEYENEWRLIVSNPYGFDMVSKGYNTEQYNFPDDHNRKFKYPISALKSITLGINFIPENISSQIGETETEVYITDTETYKYQQRILNILSRGITDVFLCIKQNFELSLQHVCVIKLNDNKFRLIEIE